MRLGPVLILGHEGQDLVEALREVQDHDVAVRPLRQSFFDSSVEVVGDVYELLPGPTGSFPASSFALFSASWSCPK